MATKRARKSIFHDYGIRPHLSHCVRQLRLPRERLLRRMLPELVAQHLLHTPAHEPALATRTVLVVLTCTGAGHGMRYPVYTRTFGRVLRKENSG